MRLNMLIQLFNLLMLLNITIGCKSISIGLPSKNLIKKGKMFTSDYTPLCIVDLFSDSLTFRALEVILVKNLIPKTFLSNKKMSNHAL